MKIKYLLLLVILSLIPLLDLFQTGLPVTHDGKDHVARIANFHQNIKEGNLIPRWASNLNWGYGHPVMMFLYPLPSYVASLFHFMGFSLVDSTKLVFAVSYILSALTMYLWLREFLSKQAAFIGGLLYIFAPYRFVDLYVRGAIGEHVAFIFPPLILYFLLKLSKSYSYKYIFLGALSMAGLILSHNAVSLMFMPVFLFYGLFLLLRNHQYQFLLSSFALIVSGFLLSAFFWLPAFFEGKYTLRDIVTQDGYLNNFGSFWQFIYGIWSYGGSGSFTLQVGPLHWLAVFASIPSIIYLYRKKNNQWLIGVGFLIVFFASILLIEKSSQFLWDQITIIQKFQFPWRFLSVVVFSTSVLGAICIATLKGKTVVVSVVFLTFALLFLHKDYWRAQSYLDHPDSYYSGIYHGTTDTGESAPIWSVRFMENEPKSPIEVIDGQAEVKVKTRTATLHNYQIKVKTQKAGFRENTLYFPGWKVFVNGEETGINYQDPNSRGLITFTVEKGNHDIAVKFTKTRLRLYADIISLVSLFILFLSGLILLSSKKPYVKIK